MNVELQDILDFFGADRYVPHAICLTGDQTIIVLFVISHVMIQVSYYLMGMSLIIARRIWVDMTPTTRGMYGSFIFACGTTHGMAVVTIYTGVYLLDVTVLAMTAAISSITAAYTAKSLWGFWRPGR